MPALALGVITRAMAHEDPQPGQVYLVLTPGQSPDLTAEALSALLDRSKATCLLIRGAVNAPRTQALIALAQSRGVAALIEDDADLALALGCDGVHLNGPKEYNAARTHLGPEAIVGVGCGASRHDAMTAGEAGADYIAFGGFAPNEMSDPALVSWWQTLMTLPCVAFGARTAADVAVLTEAGADFVAIGPELAG